MLSSMAQAICKSSPEQKSISHCDQIVFCSKVDFRKSRNKNKACDWFSPFLLLFPTMTVIILSESIPVNSVGHVCFGSSALETKSDVEKEYFVSAA